MAEHLRRFAHEEGVVFVGKAQENTPVFRTERRRSRPAPAVPMIVRRSAMVNNYYIYAVDRELWAVLPQVLAATFRSTPSCA